MGHLLVVATSGWGRLLEITRAALVGAAWLRGLAFGLGPFVVPASAYALHCHA